MIASTIWWVYAMSPKPCRGRSERIRKRGLAAPPEKTLLQTEAGRAVSMDDNAGDADPGGVLVDGDRSRRGRSVHYVRCVRARVDAVHAARDPVRGPDGIR